MRDAGIKNVLALRGDPPQGQDEWTATEGGLAYSRELIELIRDEYDFAIGAACFPEVHIHAASADERPALLQGEGRRRRALPDHPAVLRQPRLLGVRRAGRATIGIDVPIIPGIMPITNFEQIKRFTEMCGATIPDGLLARARPARRPAGGGRRLRRRLRDAAVRRAAGQRRARDPLLHAQPLPRDARDPRRAAARLAPWARQLGGVISSACATRGVPRPTSQRTSTWSSCGRSRSPTRPRTSARSPSLPSLRELGARTRSTRLDDVVVVALVLAHAVDEHGVGRPDAARQPDARAGHRPPSWQRAMTLDAHAADPTPRRSSASSTRRCATTTAGARPRRSSTRSGSRTSTRPTSRSPPASSARSSTTPACSARPSGSRPRRRAPTGRCSPSTARAGSNLIVLRMLALERPDALVLVARNIHHSIINAHQGVRARLPLPARRPTTPSSRRCCRRASSRSSRRCGATPRRWPSSTRRRPTRGCARTRTRSRPRCTTRRRTTILFVDEAWGGHLHFHPSLPPSAMDAGADVRVQSTHKLAGGLQQTGLIHWREGRVDSELMEEAFREYVTTRPSYHLLASADAAVRALAANGREALGALHRPHARAQGRRCASGCRGSATSTTRPGSGGRCAHVAGSDLVKTTVALTRLRHLGLRGLAGAGRARDRDREGRRQHDDAHHHVPARADARSRTRCARWRTCSPGASCADGRARAAARQPVPRDRRPARDAPVPRAPLRQDDRAGGAARRGGRAASRRRTSRSIRRASP